MAGENEHTTTQGEAVDPASALFAIGERIRFWHGKRRVSGEIYDVGPTMYCVTVWFGANPVNLGVDHDAAEMANASDQATAKKKH